MTTSKNRACRSTPLAASVAAMVLAAGAPAAAAATGGLSLVQDAARPPATDAAAVMDAGDQELYLEVSINQSPTGRLARFVLRGGRLHASAASLRELGLRWPGDADTEGLVALDALPGMQVQYDAATQRIALRVPVEMLDRPVARIGFSQPDRPRVDPAARAPGVILNYDLYGQRARDYGSASAFTDLRLFGFGAGVWNNTMNSRLNSGDARAAGHHDHVRLDSWWQLDLPDSMRTLIVGDAITGALDWTRATRIGGVRFSRNFALQPYRITTPLASFAGEAVLPSTVDLYIDGLRQSSQQVAPGRFELDSVPALNGMGQAQLVITDINGQSRVVGFTMYGTPELLQAGLSDWSLDLGVLRRDYGLRSARYGGDPMFAATGRRGLGDAFTVEAHVEASDAVQMAGAGGVALLGRRGGIVSASLAGSRHQGRDGLQHGLGYQWSNRAFNLSLTTLRRSDDFRDVASVEDAPMPRRTDQAFAGVSTGLGQLGMSYVAQELPQFGRSRFASLNWSRMLPRNAMLSLSVNRDLENDTGHSAYLYLSLPLDRHTSVAATARHSDAARGLSLEANRAVPGDLGGWGWRAQASLGDNRNAQAQVTRLGRYGQWSAGIDHYRGDDGAPSATLGYASANGGLVWMQGRSFAMRRVDEAFALVDTSGVAGVPVKLENRPIGRTDAHGHLLINQLNAWQVNQLSIDPMQLPADMEVDATRRDAVPEGRTGLLARFPMRRTLAVQLALRGGDGQWLPAGSRVDVESPGAPAQTQTVIGHDGMVYLQNPAPGTRLRVHGAQLDCGVALPELPAREGRVDLGELTCR